jgi:hypothetical protein
MRGRTKLAGTFLAAAPLLSWSLLNAAMPDQTGRAEQAARPGASETMSVEVSAPRVLVRVEPASPYRLGPGRRDAVSLVRARADADGAVREIIAIESEGFGVDLNDWNLKVAKAVQQWRVEPTLRDGQPVETGFRVRVQLVPEGPGR